MSRRELHLGDTVHYVSHGSPGGEYPSTCRAALITEVVDEATDTASIAVVNPTGLFFRQACPHDEHRAAGTWHWPEQ